MALPCNYFYLLLGSHRCHQDSVFHSLLTKLCRSKVRCSSLCCPNSVGQTCCPNPVVQTVLSKLRSTNSVAHWKLNIYKRVYPLSGTVAATESISAVLNERVYFYHDWKKRVKHATWSMNARSVYHELLLKRDIAKFVKLPEIRELFLKMFMNINWHSLQLWLNTATLSWNTPIF